MSKEYPEKPRQKEYKTAKPCAWCAKRTHVKTVKDEIYLCSTACFHHYCEKFGMPLKFTRGYN